MNIDFILICLCFITLAIGILLGLMILFAIIAWIIGFIHAIWDSVFTTRTFLIAYDYYCGWL